MPNAGTAPQVMEKTAATRVTGKPGPGFCATDRGTHSAGTHTTSTPDRTRAQTVGSDAAASVTSSPTAEAGAITNGSAVPSFPRTATATTKVDRSTIAAFTNASSRSATVSPADGSKLHTPSTQASNRYRRSASIEFF